MVPFCASETGCESWRQQCVCVVVRRELCRGIRLGSRVTVVGVPTHRLVNQSQRTHIDTTIEVLYNALQWTLTNSKRLLGLVNMYSCTSK